MLENSNETQKQLLEQGIKELALPNIPVDTINIYLSELLKWNRVYNLSGFKTLEDHVARNVLDCLAVHPFIKGQILMDLGTGAGLPGLLLAIVNPEQEWFLLDSNGKKTRFLNQIKQQLALKNVEVIHSRAEDFQTQQTFDGICSRAFDKIPDSLALCQHLFNSPARFYAMKGKVLVEDIENLPKWASIEKVQRINVPMINEERHLISVYIQQ